MATSPFSLEKNGHEMVTALFYLKGRMLYKYSLAESIEYTEYREYTKHIGYIEYLDYVVYRVYVGY